MDFAPFPLRNKVAFITGGAQRIGAVIARTLHAQEMNIVFQYRTSRQAAARLCDELNQERPNSAHALPADLLRTEEIPTLMEEVAAVHGRLDAVVNNASVFYPTPLETLSENDWDILMDTNAKAPLFIAKAAAPYLAHQHGTPWGGCIVNIADIYGVRPLVEHPIYCATKAALIMLTKSLARELGPVIRVNAIAPGAILWPAQGIDDTRKKTLLARTPLQRIGQPEDIARTVLFLIRDATYSTGNVIVVDGGRTMIE
uniref:Pteridine reductase n=1 Tax=Candidatus Kentrum sp. FM TaxID=2126340 RepID=A0A450S882_9GAMM|nr:MAG: pteridine reductase [Candidatus Kentron sp. FM]VFJ48088.1 MAG: pteridine reductase [Candidatus Kentron sp. FM]VFK06391.1 MAG: pteridine reductase [Candidatus Kentron sp. FM]